MWLTAVREPGIIYLPGREPADARQARRQARDLLEAWGLGEHADLGELVAGELIANAIRHGREPIWMRLSADGGGLRVEVHDGGAGRPVRKRPGAGDELGRAWSCSTG